MLTVNFVEDQEIKQKTEEQLNQLKETLEAKDNQAKGGVERTKTVSYLTGTLMDKSNDWPACSEMREQKRLSPETKALDKTKEA